MNEWIEAVAQRAQMDPAATDAALARCRVMPSPNLPRPRRLHLARVAFSGEKVIGDRTEPFTFQQDLGPGAWCFASYEDNLVGKSSVLEIIRWCLSGRSHLQEDVRGWLRSVELDGVIEGERFGVRFGLTDRRPVGTLIVQTPGGERRTVATFATDGDFEQVLGTFMLDRLGMEPTPFWQRRPRQEEGDPQFLTWAGYVNVLFVADASHGVVVGTDSWPGQVPDLLRVFLGVPWGHTYSTARVALQQHGQEIRGEQRRRTEDATARGRSVAEIESRLDAARATFTAMGGVEDDVTAIDEALAEVQSSAESVAGADARVRERESELALIVATLKEDRQVLLDWTESVLARRFLQTLEPKLCPRCDTSIDAARREREASDGVCSVCASPLHLEDLDANATDALRTDVETLEREAGKAEKRLTDARSVLLAEETTHTRARVRLREVGQRSESVQRRRQAELEVARLQGVLDERREVIAAAEAPIADDGTTVILSAAVAEAQQRMRAAQGDLFADVNVQVLLLGRAFGIEALESVVLDSGGKLKIHKGGEQSWSKDLTRGERLRLKIAVVIAMLRLGEQRGVGRHPGLLLIDSPGAEESGAEDLGRLLRELASLTVDLPHLQIITTSARADLVLTALPSDHVRCAPKGGTLW